MPISKLANGSLTPRPFLLIDCSNNLNIIDKELKDALFSELSFLVRDPEGKLTGVDFFGVSPFFFTKLTIVTDPVKAALGLAENSNEKQKYRLGSRIDFELVITSHFPKSIVLDDLGVTIVRVEDFESRKLELAKGNEEMMLPDSLTYDVMRPVALNSTSTTIRPGDNKIAFAFTPTTIGQFLFGKLKIEWGNATLVDEFAR